MPSLTLGTEPFLMASHSHGYDEGDDGGDGDSGGLDDAVHPGHEMNLGDASGSDTSPDLGLLSAPGLFPYGHSDVASSGGS